MPGCCVWNASELERPGLRFTWGYAHGPGEAWTPHAWLTDEDGRVVDPTWKDTGSGFEYAPTPAGFDPFADDADALLECLRRLLP
jgi:hypothetical protein